MSDRQPSSHPEQSPNKRFRSSRNTLPTGDTPHGAASDEHSSGRDVVHPTASTDRQALGSLSTAAHQLQRTVTPDHHQPAWVAAGVHKSPSKASGKKLWIGGDFGRIARKNGLIVDKTLMCKLLVDNISEAICICLPRRFGKTFSLSIIEEFFNVVHGNDVDPVDGLIDIVAPPASRLKLFEDSLLWKDERAFFDENFCKHPVIRIDFK
ncbi:hypothetical protein GGI21_006635, partial [Coemansia aciculifera]